MKKFRLIVVFIILLATSAGAQNWFSSDHRWVFNLSGGFGGFDEDFEMYAVADTVIQGHQSRKWAFLPNDFVFISPKYTYSDGPRAYYFQADLDSFVMIYDLSLPVGSMVTIPRYFGSFTYKIDSIDMVQAGNMMLKRQRVHYINQNGQPSGWNFDILENIGMVGQPFDVGYPTCSFVLIPDYECSSVVDGIDIKFLCFSTPAGSFNPYSGACTVVGTNEAGDKHFSIVPNPAADFFEIQWSSHSATLESVQLMDIGGKTIRHWNGASLICNLQGIPAGLYLVATTFSDGKRVVQKLVKA